jgi:2-polyprenyl-6-methoxyphenol hydroxylase-like FAD-dependent oxidoreductase
MAKALIVGAGICGPVTAIALQRARLDATVYELHVPTAEDAGSYLTVATNGIDALRTVNADKPVLAAGFSTRATILFSGTGKRLGRVPIGKTLPDGTETQTIKRAWLHRILHEEAARRGICIEFGKRLVVAEVIPHGVLARFEDGTEAVGDLLIGCDGVHSVTRRIIDPAASAPRYVGLLNFGGYTRGVAVSEPGVWHMIFGKRAFFGYAVDPSGGTVWFANVPRHASTQAERTTTTAEEWKQRLIDLFVDDWGPATNLIAGGALELVADNTHDLPSVPTWYKGPMIILGDAAHAPAPTSGQGASIAIEDAVALAKCLRDVPDTSSAFATFEAIRRHRVERIVAQGARGSSNKAVGPVGRLVRDLLLPFLFRYVVTEKSLAWIYDYHIDWNTPITMARS